jgi:predicted TIM-barrel fold metal-dependent hydrolase
VIARRYPSVPVLCHGLGGVSGAAGLDSPGMAEVLASAQEPNIHLKVAGLHYGAERGWDYPWPDMVALFERVYDAYGPHRLVWGSDFPAATRFCMFRQTIEVVRTHCPFLNENDLRLILGENLRAILATGQAAG